MDKHTELIDKFGIYQCCVDVIREEDQPFIPRWNYDLLAEFIIEREKKLQEENERLREALKELHAMVKGECPSLLDEDSGGDARLDMQIGEALERKQP